MPFLPSRVPFRNVLRLLFGIALFAVALPRAGAQAQQIPSSGPRLLEAGPPAFKVLSKEGLGMNSPPLDLRLMPDGRVLINGINEIALGDGVRWEVYRQAPNDKLTFATGLAVDAQGEIFLPYADGFARLELGTDAHWRLIPLAGWPASVGPARTIPRFFAEAGEEWIWHGGNGTLLAWKPGAEPRYFGHSNTIEHVFEFAGSHYVSDHTSGELTRIGPGGTEVLPQAALASTSDTVTCSLPFGDELLVGTYARGLRLFNGTGFRDFPNNESIAPSARVNALCQTEGGMFVAAVQGTGLVFFNAQGRTVQILGRQLDHRLARINKLVAAPGGLIWGLLSDGVLCLEFPSRYSNYEPLIGTGVHTAHPYRLDGKLWLMADGRSYRGAYDELGRIVRLEADAPPDRFVFAFSTYAGYPVAGTQAGAYFRHESGWVNFYPESRNLRVVTREPVNGRWLYAAENEVGWLQAGPDGVKVVARFPVPGLGNVFGNMTDAQGTVWLELGSGRMGRVQIRNGRPEVSLHGREQGVPEGWVQIFVIDGVARFNVADRLMRYDEATDRLVPDPELAGRFPDYKVVVGRPGIDARGRFWIAADNGLHLLEPKPDGGWSEVREKLPPGLLPFYFTFEDGGVVWMHAERRIVRYDPDLPVAQPAPLRALITHVSLPGSRRTIFAMNEGLPELQYTDNSLVAHFLAPGDPFTEPVAFEVRLEGAGSEWTAAGGSGSAVFNGLAEGRYVLRVRPRAGTNVGAEDTLAFTILPPWYRTGLAYSGYAVAAFGLIWLARVVQRRENQRLEHLMVLRTRELNETNFRLAHQVEEIRMLSQAIEQCPVAILITNPAGIIVFANPCLATLTGYTVDELIGQDVALLRSAEVTAEVWAGIHAALQAGEPWNGQLVNRGKDGRSRHVRATISPLRSPSGQIRLHLFLEEDITEWLAEQERRRRLESQLVQSQKLESLGTLAGGIAHDFNNILTGMLGYTELARQSPGADKEMQKQLGEVSKAGLRAKDLVAQILTFSRQSAAQLTPIDLAGPVEEAVRLLRASTPATIAIVAELESGTVRADTTQIQQVVLNLVTNSVHAMRGRTGRIEITLRRMTASPALAAEVSRLPEGPTMCLRVSDQGKGMDAATLERIFDPFFTTKDQGEGTGLGLSIVQGIIASHNGAYRVQSKVDEGTTFELYFPLRWEQTATPPPTGPAPKGARQEILVVDDERMVAEYMTLRLKRLDYNVTTFTDPRQALAACQADPGKFHAIVTDLTMPHLTGVDLIRQIRQLGRIIPAVIVTGYGKDASMHELPRCQMLYKPFSGEDLARTLAQVLRR